MTVTDYDDIIYTKLTRGLEMTLKTRNSLTVIRQEYQPFSLLMMTSKGGLILLALPTVFAVGF